MADSATLELIDLVLRGARPAAMPPSHYGLASTIRLAAGRRAGRFYDPDSDACQRFILKQLDSGRFRRVAICAPPQVGGKTQSAILPATLRAIIFARQLVGYGLPTLEALDKAWNEKISASIRGSGYGDHLPKKGPGSKGGRPDVVYFEDPDTGEREGGIVFMTGGAYGSTVSVVVVDDVDKFTRNGRADREAVEDILHRADSYGDQSLRIVAGTIEFDDGSLILSMIEDSTHTRAWPSCPSCGAHQELDWANVHCDYTSDQSAYESARYRCTTCAVLWTEDERQRAIEWQRVLFCDHGQRVVNGKVVGDPSKSLTCGLIWGALESAQADLRDLCVEYRAAAALLARGDHSLMRKFVRYRLCRPYTADIEELEAGTTLTWQALLTKSQRSAWGPSIHTSDRSDERAGHTYSRHIAEPPVEAAVAFGGVDIQGNRAYWTLDGANQEGTSWDIGWGYEMARADHQPWNEAELHALLDRIDLLLTEVADGLPIQAIALDTGDFTDELLRWLKARPQGTPWRAVKGSGAHKKQPGDVEGIVHVIDGLHLVHTENTRDLVQATYRRPSGTIGAANLPNGLGTSATDRAYLQHLCGEVAVVDPKTRKKRVKKVGRWDWLDAKRYAYAMRRLWLERLTNPPPAPRRYRIVNGYA